MAKLTLTDVANLYGNPTSAANTINANNALIEAALENTLSRDGSIPNQLNSDLDLNHNDVTNVQSLSADKILLNGEEIVTGDVYNNDSLKIVNNLSDVASASQSRTNLGLGDIATHNASEFQPYDAGLASIAGLITSANQIIYTTASDVWTTTSLTAYGRSLIGVADAATGRSTLGLGTAATQNTGTSGANIPLLNGVNVWSASQAINGSLLFSFDGTTSSNRGFNITTSASTRWRVFGSATAETGGNAGTDLMVNSYDDTGTFIGTPLKITRSTGVVTLSQPLPASSGGSGTTTSTGTGSVVLSTSPVLTTPNLGTPSAVILTNGTGLPISSGVSGLATGVATFLATPTSANLAAAVTNETGTGALVFATSPTLVTPVLGTPTSGVLTNCTGLPLASVTGATAAASMVATSGSFTPVLNFGGATTGITYSTQTGIYWRIGSLIYVTINISLTSKGTATGSATVTGLPFTNASSGSILPAGIGNFNTTYPAWARFSAASGSSTLNVESSTGVSLTDTNFAANTVLNLAGIYNMGSLT